MLPPPLEPTDEPLVRVTIATSTSAGGLPPFGAGTFAVQARHEGTIGNYPLVMPMTTEQSVIGGRETFGEPKKLGRGRARPRRRPGARAPSPGSAPRSSRSTGTVGRRRSSRTDGTRTDFYFKFLPAPDGKGFDAEPALVYCHRDETTRDARARSTAR